MDGGGSTFLEQYFASLKLFVKEYPKHHALFAKVPPFFIGKGNRS